MYVSRDHWCEHKFTSPHICPESTIFSERRWQSFGQWREGPHHRHVRRKSVGHSHAVNNNVRGVCHDPQSCEILMSPPLQLELHATSYTQSLHDLYSENPAFQYIQINLQENILKSILVHIFLSSLRSKIPPHQHARYLVSRQNMVRISLHLVNCIIDAVYGLSGVRSGTAWNDQQSHWLRLPCG
jgi:hypothetical protein